MQEFLRRFPCGSRLWADSNEVQTRSHMPRSCRAAKCPCLAKVTSMRDMSSWRLTSGCLAASVTCMFMSLQGGSCKSPVHLIPEKFLWEHTWNKHPGSEGTRMAIRTSSCLIRNILWRRHTSAAMALKTIRAEDGVKTPTSSFKPEYSKKGTLKENGCHVLPERSPPINGEVFVPVTADVKKALNARKKAGAPDRTLGVAVAMPLWTIARRSIGRRDGLSSLDARVRPRVAKAAPLPIFIFNGE